ncbi:hypothetical protein [Alcaligenes sp. Marseille-Q7550]
MHFVEHQHFPAQTQQAQGLMLARQDRQQGLVYGTHPNRGQQRLLA